MAKRTCEVLSLTHLRMDEVWDPAGGEFAEWLKCNVAALGEVLLMDLELAAPEPAGDAPPPEVLAFDVNGDRRVMLQTQFGGTDTLTLGRMVAAAGAQDPMVVVWIAESIEDVHRDALRWLNRRSEAHVEFFGVEVEVLGIGESQASPLFRPVIAPRGWEEEGRKVVPGREESERGYRLFWRGVIDTLVAKRFFANRAAWDRRAFAVSTGVPGVQYYVSFDETAGQVHLGVHVDLAMPEMTQDVFERLRARKSEIESDLSGFEVSEPLEWNAFEDLGAYWIGISHPGTIQLDDEALQRLQGWVIERLVKMKYVFDKYVQDVADAVPSPEETIRLRTQT